MKATYIANQSEGDPGKSEDPNPKDDKNSSTAAKEPQQEPAVDPAPQPAPNASTEQLVVPPLPTPVSEQLLDTPQKPTTENNVSPEEQKLTSKRSRKSISSISESDPHEEGKEKPKNPGRWSAEEHRRFLEGITFLLWFSVARLMEHSRIL